MPEHEEASAAELAELDRQWLAHELHDGPIQVVVGAKMCAEALAARTAAGQPVDPAAVTELVALLDQAILGMRRLLTGLRPPEMDDADWHVALARWAAQARRGQAAEIELGLDPVTAALEESRQVLAFRIAQESLSNALRHAAAERITVRARPVGEAVLLTIEDDGRGFSPAEVPADRYGLRGISERARLLGGHASIGSTPGGGTHIEVCFPFAAPAPRSPAERRSP